jgi:CubicO group peptidase (beta-lactamase class C family)
MQQYIDFDLDIGTGSGGVYPIRVLFSTAGESRGELRLPFEQTELQARLLALATLSDAQEFGRALCDALLDGDIRSSYDISQRDAAQQGKGLRLKLRIQAPELAALPWEFLYDTRQSEFVCLSRSTPLVRYLELPLPFPPLGVEPPLRILGMTASPSDLPPLKVEAEQARVEQALASLRERGLVELVWLAGQTWRDLQGAMLAGPWHVFHFIGHGGFDATAGQGFVALADEDGATQRLGAPQLGRLLDDHMPLRLALLNACDGAKGSEQDMFASTAATLVARGLPAVVAMQNPISDRAAREFARSFYGVIAEGYPIDAALSEARKAMSMDPTTEWATPVLFMRAPDGVLFSVSASAANEPAIVAASTPAPTAAEGPTAPAEPVPTPRPPRPAKPPKRSARTTARTPVQPEIDQIFADIANDTPGAAVLVLQDGEVRFAQGYGCANLKTGAPITPQTMFHLTAIGCQFTALAIMLFHADGLLDYDDPIARHLPELAGWSNIPTIRQLLCHMSGLRGGDSDEGSVYDTLLSRRRAPTNTDLLKWLADTEVSAFAYEPGDHCDDSSLGYDLLGTLIERIGGQPFADVLQKRIFDPLGMKQTFGLPNRKRRADPQCAQSYISEQEGFTLSDSVQMECLVGRGSVYASLEDLVRFELALASGALIRPELLAEAFVPARLNDGGEGPQGFGWWLDQNAGERYASLSGAWDGFLTCELHFLDRFLSVFVLTNRSDLDIENVIFEIAGLYR